MNLAEAKDYFKLDLFVGFHAIKDPLSEGWMLVFEGAKERSWVMQTALGKDKIYSTMDSLNQDVGRVMGRPIFQWTHMFP